MTEHLIPVARMDGEQMTVGALPWNTKFKGKGKDKNGKNKGNQDGSLDDAGKTREFEAETGSLELVACDASQSRCVRFTEPLEQRICDTGAARDGIPIGSC